MSGLLEWLTCSSTGSLNASHVPSSRAHQWSRPAPCPLAFLTLRQWLALFIASDKNYTSPCSSASESSQVWRTLRSCPQSTSSHSWAAASLESLLDYTTVFHVTEKLGASGSSLTHLISSQVCRFYFVISWLCSLRFISAAHHHPPSQSILIMWQFLCWKPQAPALPAGGRPPSCHPLPPTCRAVLLWLSAGLPPPLLSVPPLLFYTETGICFKIVLPKCK